MDRMLDRHDPRLLEQLILGSAFNVSFLRDEGAEVEIPAG